MGKCEFKAVDLSEVRWIGRNNIVSGNYTMFYSDVVNAGKDTVIVLRNYIFKRVT